MPSVRQVAVALLLALSLASCRRDPNVAKKKYLESGNLYLEHGNLKAAIIQYNNATKIDPKYGPAHYKLATVYLQQKPTPQVALALKEYRRAVELLKDDQAYQKEYTDALVKLSELNLVFLFKDDSAMNDVETYVQELFRKDPNSFDGHRLTGDLAFTKAKKVYQLTPTVADGLFANAMEEYRKADAIKSGDPGVSMQIAMVLEQQKHYAEAEPYFRKVIDKDKTAQMAYMNFYTLYMVENKYPQGEQLLKEAIQNNPKNVEYMQRLAYHYGATGRRDDMVNVLQQIKSRAKDYEIPVYQVVGSFYLRMGDAESALREYREGIIKDAKNKANYQHSIIEVLTRQGKRAEAAEVNSQILKENPKDPDARSLEATFLLDSGDINNALMKLQAVVTSAPDNAVAHYQLGRAYLASGRPDSRESARGQFELAIAKRPDMLQARLGLAELQVLHSEYQGALDSVQDILTRDPNNENAKLIQSQALLGMKKYGESDNLIQGMLKANPSSPDAYYQAGVSALTQGKAKEAESAFMRSYELNPANAKGLLGVVDADIQQGKADQAMGLLLSESKKAPNRLDLLLLLGVTAQREGKFNESVAYFNQVLNGLDKKSKSRADIYLQIANSYRLAGDRDNAIVNCMKAREILPDNETVLSALGLVLDQANRKSEARKAYEASLKVNPNSPAVLNNLAYLMAETNSDLDVALNYAQHAKGLVPNNPEISDTYGWILLKKAMADQAIPVFRDLVSRYPQQSTYHYHLAMAYNGQGNNAKAVEEAREAMKHSPPTDEQQKIQEMLTKLSGK